LASSIGGAQVHVRDLASHFGSQNHVCCVLAGQPGTLAQQLQQKKIHFESIATLDRSIRPWADLRAIREIIRVLRRIQPDIVSLHSSKAGILGRLASRSLGIPCVFTAHGWAFTDGVSQVCRTGYRVVEKMIAPLAKRIITVSDYDRQLALALRVAPVDKIRVIHNGMPDVSSSLRADPTRDPVRIVMTARFQKQKDFDTLFQALSGISTLKWELHLIGDGPLLDSYKTRARAVGIAERTTFWGAQENVEEHLSRAQLFVLCSRWEGFPRSILEAMRAGLPVVASDVGGVSESVQDAKTGYLAPRENAEVLRDRLRLLIESPKLREQMGAEGRKTYERQFTLVSMAEKTMQVYKEALHAGA
jgi:glycosyltransferase involved in cell wall biosynthesis